MSEIKRVEKSVENMQGQLTHVKKDLKQRGLDAVKALKNGDMAIRAEVVL
jgi:uncharacterized protein (UPF0335 family)